MSIDNILHAGSTVRPRMAGEPARDYLMLTRQWSDADTRHHLISIDQAFREYWAMNPSEEDFVAVMSRVFFTARMAYIMAMHQPPSINTEKGIMRG